MSPSPASKKANVVQFAAAAEGGSSAVAAKIKAKTQFSDDGTSSSAAIAEDRSVKSHYVLNSVIDVALSKDCNNLEEDGPEGKPGDEQPRAASKASKSRMETYKAEWAGAEGAAERPLLPEDVERWREEKARRHGPGALQGERGRHVELSDQDLKAVARQLPDVQLGLMPARRRDELPAGLA